MKTLLEIKNKYAQEQGYNAWGRLQYDTFTNGEEMEYHMDEICIRAQKEYLKKEAEDLRMKIMKKDMNDPAYGTDTGNKDIFPMDRERLLVLLSVSLNINFSTTTKEALTTVFNNLFYDGYLSKSQISGVWHLSAKGENYLGQLVTSQNLFESKLANDVAGIKTFPIDRRPDLYELANESYRIYLELTEKVENSISKKE